MKKTLQHSSIKPIIRWGFLMFSFALYVHISVQESRAKEKEEIEIEIQIPATQDELIKCQKSLRKTKSNISYQAQTFVSKNYSTKPVKQFKLYLVNCQLSLKEPEERYFRVL